MIDRVHGITRTRTQWLVRRSTQAVVKDADLSVEKHPSTRNAITIGLTARLWDSIGLDTCLAIQQTLYHGTGDSKYRPSVLLERMVDAEWYGKKSGKGFYEYPSQ